MTDTLVLGSRPKKARKPQARSLPLREAIRVVAAEYDQMSVRQLFYQLVSRRAIEKTESAYKRVVDVSGQMRLDGSLDYRKITDGHRTRRAVWSHNGVRAALENVHDLYRRNYWLDQPWHVEVWCEKDALTGVIQPVCNRYGVTYVATRGFPSITLRYESALEMRQIGKPTMIFYFGDHDASGQQISDNLEAELRHHGAEVIVERMALHPVQIRQWSLPTRPGKTSDSRHAAFTARYGNASVELDALPPNILTGLVERAIWTVIDEEAWQRAHKVEELERETLESLALLDLAPGTTVRLHESDR
ncbi:MAG: hypothetical protein M3Q71_10775 [Chloroflexota bacterium]|nr:hypothetical protein [Chloroflexota bacterium]